MSCILELYFELYHEERYQNIRLFTYHYVMFYDTALLSLCCVRQIMSLMNIEIIKELINLLS